MKVDVFALFPSMFDGPLDESIIKRAQTAGYLEINVRDLREFTYDTHRTVDDRPFGGGPGMILKPEPVFEAVESVRTDLTKVIMLAPVGRRYDQGKARELAGFEHLVLLCGNYEGFDERIREALVDEVISIGDFVLTNGALPAMILIDSVTRLIPGVLGDEASAKDESFGEDGLLEYPHYTRPAEFRGMKVPAVLMSGNHGEIVKWRKEMAKKRTVAERPDLLSAEKLYLGTSSGKVTNCGHESRIVAKD
ncbi:MAG: tRNA (guanine-N(1)-)-methyltransferase [Verrucomicrobia subdivision 3 bacterium]|nr:tRNA (guanine-N(1)-)-methyltransferase [Limisphaerales bacterium]MCS1417297.1 tRNA (guanine-N(1)-)-methyltransferase [Limisphaerales bacterium]